MSLTNGVLYLDPTAMLSCPIRAPPIDLNDEYCTSTLTSLECHAGAAHGRSTFVVPDDWIGLKMTNQLNVVDLTND